MYSTRQQGDGPEDIAGDVSFRVNTPWSSVKLTQRTDRRLQRAPSGGARRGGPDTLDEDSYP